MSTRNYKHAKNREAMKGRKADALKARKEKKGKPRIHTGLKANRSKSGHHRDKSGHHRDKFQIWRVSDGKRHPVEVKSLGDES